ncbi:MAG: MFS transporter [Ktedonobacteraceae bacterium]|nr:MFS transporter [Ktedonobacteraceae bacterium]
MEATSSTLPAAQESGRRLRGSVLVIIMVALLLTAFLEALDNLIVTPALPRIASSLHGFDHYTWVVTAYLLAATAVVPLAGKLSDLFGRKGFLLGGVVIFLLGSGLAGASQTMDQLILFRALQGLGTGIGIGLVATVVGDLFSPEERASKQGLLGIVFGVSQLCGPTLGGWITDHGPLVAGLVAEDTRWRWLFYLNLPIGLLALLVLWIFLPGQVARRSGFGRIDWWGAGLLVVATCSLLLGLSARSSDWTSPPVIALFVAAVVFYVLFFIVERKAVEPIIPLGLLWHRIFGVDALLTFIQGMVLIAVFIPLSLFLQGVLTLSPTEAGVLITVLSVSLSLGAALAGGIISLRKRYQMAAIVGAVMMTVGALLLAIMSMTQQSNILLIGFYLVLVGLGTGSFFAIQMVVAQNVIPQTQLGVGSGVIRYLSQLGLTLGAALMGIVVNGAVAGDMGTGLPATNAARLALSGVLQNGFGVVLVLSVLVLIATLFLKDVPGAQPEGE